MTEHTSELRLITLTEPEFRRVIREAVAEGLGAQKENEVLTLAEAAELCRYKDPRSFLRYAREHKVPHKELSKNEFRFLRSDLMGHLKGKR